jgi:hypothetical protein
MAADSIPARPDTPHRVGWSTYLGLALAVLGTAMALPYAGLSTSYYAEPGDYPPYGWEAKLYYLALLVGPSALLIGRMRQKRERDGRSRADEKVAKGTIVIALVGACVWAFPACLDASSGM